MNTKITRRRFIKKVAALSAALAGVNFIRTSLKSDASTAITRSKEALHYEQIDETTVKCVLCPNECVLKNGQRSFCRVREPKNGKLYSLVYETPCSVHVDPIEKKPIYHMFPGSKAFSIATVGCNLRCKFCQNWQISQEYPESAANRHLPCKSVVDLALKNNCRSIAYTYSEPTVFYEYMLETAGIAREKGVKNIWVTGGFINPKPLRRLCSVIDAANIDFKGMSDKYLRETCGERLKPLLSTIKLTKEMGVWVELTNLVVPTLNDDPAMIKDMCAWIKENLGADTPLHFSRFWPMYQLKNLPPTPLDTLKNAKAIAEMAGLNYVYIGNVPESATGNTACPYCKKIVVKRTGYFVLSNHIINSKCGFCGQKIAGVWD
ncbi:MAG: AmmeMemoRadiSam system radical SAM enzyme [Omnitrophica bacterium]|nr:AmmeMemoRadiSam system radical SAM enzyme [Candidatus Omnitrophota bacterium]